MPSGEGGQLDLPYVPFVDANGSIYYYTPLSAHIVQLSPGPNGKVVRTIDLPKEAREQKRSFFHNPYIFATAGGQVYFYAAYGPREPAIYVWSAKANGTTPPSRVIVGNLTQSGVYGVDSHGNAWVVPIPGSTFLRYFGPRANHRQRPTRVNLQGSIIGINTVRVASTDELIYEGPTAPNGTPQDGPPVLIVAPPFGNGPIRTLNLPADFDGSDLLGVTF